MKLKLSTLVVIIAIIFFAYYYFSYSPCQAPAGEEAPPLPMLVPPGEEGATPEEEVTMLENFGVTSIDEDDYEPDYYEPAPQSNHVTQNVYDSESVYDLAGNVRPDNVMHVEPVTLL